MEMHFPENNPGGVHVFDQSYTFPQKGITITNEIREYIRLIHLIFIAYLQILKT